MRAIWKGSIGFGLVNIPVNLYSATVDREVKFALLHKDDMSEIRYARICKAEEKEVPYEEIVKGYEYEKGLYVVLTEEDLQKANIEKSKRIEIVSFADEHEIDSIYFEKPYYLEPDKKSGQAYAILRDALLKSKKVGIARYVFRNHERLGIIKVHDHVLILNQMRLHSEVLPVKHLEVPKGKTVSSKELSMALELIEHFEEPFKIEQYHDTYVDDLKEIITKKAKGKKIRPKEAKERPSKVHDIASLLRESLKSKAKPKKKKRAA